MKILLVPSRADLRYMILSRNSSWSYGLSKSTSSLVSKIDFDYSLSLAFEDEFYDESTELLWDFRATLVGLTSPEVFRISGDCRPDREVFPICLLRLAAPASPRIAFSSLSLILSSSRAGKLMMRFSSWMWRSSAFSIILLYLILLIILALAIFKSSFLKSLLPGRSWVSPSLAAFSAVASPLKWRYL